MMSACSTRLIFSFDSGNKNLGISVVETASDVLSKLRNIALRAEQCCKHIKNQSTPAEIKAILDEIEALFDNLVKIKWAGVIDLLNGGKLKGSDMIVRTERLKGLLQYIDSTYGRPDEVLLEDQMHKNFGTNAVNEQIIMHYVDARQFINGTCSDAISSENNKKTAIVTMSGKLKNNVILDKETWLKSKWGGLTNVKGAASYRLNKNRAIFNYTFFRKTHDVENKEEKKASKQSEKCTGKRSTRSKAFKADEADAFMMCYVRTLLC
jgi:hypothetical protein